MGGSLALLAHSQISVMGGSLALLAHSRISVIGGSLLAARLVGGFGEDEFVLCPPLSE